MITTHSNTNLCLCGEITEDLINKAFGIEVYKALNPLDPDDYLVISARLSRALYGIARPEQGKALRQAIKTLDVDWPNINDTARRRVIEAAKNSIAEIPKNIIAPITRELEVRGSRVVRGSRKGTREQVSATMGARIGVDMALQDERVIGYLSRSQGLFVTDSYVNRSEFFSAKARNIVSEGLEQGLGRDEISSMLQREIRGQLGPRRSRHYFNIISGVFTNRSRTYGQLISYQEAGIRRWIFDAVLDERTTPQCALLHGRTWTVRQSLDRINQMERSNDPQAVKDLMPWIRKGRNPDGSEFLYTQDRQGVRSHVADIVRNRQGNRDDLGEYRNVVNNQVLADMGANNPPLHPLCRSTIIADV
jgi:SPP1 gp7 family putative phage head morphogenesis protein